MLEIVLASVALALATLGLLGSWVAWYSSRAQHNRAFEGRIEENLQNAARRIESCEARMVEWRTALNGTLDELASTQDRIVKERKRVEVANKRAELIQGEGDGQIPTVGTRSDQLAAVQRHFQGR